MEHQEHKPPTEARPEPTPFDPPSAGAAPRSQTPPPPRRSVVGPMILIVLGAFFLAHNLGWLHIHIWEMLWKLWPVWLIAVGLEMLIGRRTHWGSWMVLGLALFFLGGIFWLVPATQVVVGGVNTQSISQPLDGARTAKVEIAAGIGQLRVGALSAADRLVQGSVTLYGRQQLDQSFGVMNGEARYKLGAHGSVWTFPIRQPGGAPWSLQLNSQVPLDLRVSTGVGESVLDLSALHLTGLHLDTGVGETTVILPGRGQPAATVRAGIGEVTIRIPRGMAARIRVSTGIGSVSVHSAYPKQGDHYLSPGFDAAADRLDLEVHAGFGAVQILEG